MSIRSSTNAPLLLQALAKNFGVAAAIVQDLKLGPGPVDREDLAVGSSGLSSGRDRAIETSTPRDTAKWRVVSIPRSVSLTSLGTLNLQDNLDGGLDGGGIHGNRYALINPTPGDPMGSVDVWLPKDRGMVDTIVDVYFTRLNIHRPVFARREFERGLERMYGDRGSGNHKEEFDAMDEDEDENQQDDERSGTRGGGRRGRRKGAVHDPGFLCSVYLVLALGTLSELNFRATNHSNGHGQDDGATLSAAITKKLMPSDWPEHDEFFERALSVKPDLRVTISSLQALILLHWYLYTEVRSPLFFSLRCRLLILHLL